MTVRRLPPWVLATLLAIGSATVVSVARGAEPDCEEQLAGCQGTDTSLPLTDSAVTVTGRGEFSALRISVNQTRDLTNQAVSLTWTGGAPTVGPGRYGAQFLQVMQCWGDDDGKIPENPGPPPEQCVYGATGGTYFPPSGAVIPGGNSITRVISVDGWANFDPDDGYLDPRTKNVWRPFRAVDGTVIEAHTDPTFNPLIEGGSYWLNPYFDQVTSNEIPAAFTFADGTGQETVEVVTGIESSGLGCGQPVEPLPGGGRRTPQCWIVVVPRGSGPAENVGTPFEVDAAFNGVLTSPLSTEAWRNRIAIPIDFVPVDSSCAIGQEERRIVGNELLLRAVRSWQPPLCAEEALPPYSYSPIGDASARQQITSGTLGAAGLAVVQRPFVRVAADDPVVYAPIAVSGIAIGFNVERFPRSSAPPEAQAIAGVRVAQLNLTPRLVAKLLTQSYRSQLDIYGLPPYDWVATNPRELSRDPDFLRFNPEFEQLNVGSQRTFGGLQIPSGNSDAALQVWEWILADPEAKAWLDGAPDEWGMRVNPAYATSAAVNRFGVGFGTPLPNTFPKAEPYCYQPPARGSFVPPQLCAAEWLPYSRGLADSARIARIAFDGARTILDPTTSNPTQVWRREPPQAIGVRSILSLTDTPSAAQFGLQVARLSRAGDGGDDRTFIAPDEAALAAGLAAMRARSEPTVLEPSLEPDAVGAYPLTALSYAAIAPVGLDATARTEYAAFIEFASTVGQTPGLQPGELPPGYLSLPDALRSAASVAVGLVRDPSSLVAPTPPPSTSPPAGPTTTEPPVATASPGVPVPVAPSSPALAPQGSASSRSAGQSRAPSASPAAGPEPTTPSRQPPTSEPPSTTPTTEPLATSTSEAPPASLPPAVTPTTDAAAARFAVPLLGGVALVAALGALELTKRPRRLGAIPADQGVEPTEAQP